MTARGMLLKIDDLWFGAAYDPAAVARVGFKVVGGGTHQSKTLMLNDLQTLWAAGPATEAEPAIVERNILGKRSAKARDVAVYRLEQLYGVASRPPLARFLAALWTRDAAAQPLLALLCALARDPSLRDASPAALDAPIGAQVRWPAFAAVYEARHPARLGAKMLKSLSQNCASTYSQAGYLRGKLAKVRIRAVPTPHSAAFAALLAELAGFGGPALLASRWLDVLDLPLEGRLRILQAAADLDLLQLRTGGDIVELSVRDRMASTLGIPTLGDV